MAEYDNKLSGALFKNDKEGNEKRPDYKGNYTDGEGNEFYVSAWIKESKKGDKYMSLSMQAKNKQPSNSNVGNAPSEQQDSNSLPF